MNYVQYEQNVFLTTLNYDIMFHGIRYVVDLQTKVKLKIK